MIYLTCHDIIDKREWESDNIMKILGKQVKNTIIDKMIIFLLGLYAINIFNKGAYIAFFFVPFILFRKHSKRSLSTELVVTTFLLLLFSVVYASCVRFYGFSESITVIVSYALAPTIMYLLGYTFIDNKNQYNKMFSVFFTIAMGTLMFAFLSVLKTSSLYGSLDNAFYSLGKRDVFSFWGQNNITVTGLNTYVSFSAAIVPLIFFENKKMKYIKITKTLIVINYLISLYIILQTGSRTGILILISSILTSFFIVLSKRKKTIKKISKKKVISTYLLGCFFILIIITFIGNSQGIIEQIENSLTIQRLQNTQAVDDPRIQVWKEAFVGIYRNPLGGRQTHLSLDYAHNLWLDVGYDAGIIPFLLIIIITTIGLISVVRILLKDYSAFLKTLVVTTFSSIFIIFLLEPIMQGWFYYFVVFCLFMGVLHKLIFLDRNSRYNKNIR